MSVNRFGSATYKALGISKRVFLVNLLLFASFFTFYYIFSLQAIPQAIGKTNENLATIQAFFSFSIAGTLLLISHLASVKEKKQIIFSCVATSISLLLLFIIPTYEIKLLCIFIIGISFGMGQLASYTHFWGSTKSEERGRVGGLIGFIALPFYFIASNVLASSLDFFGKIILYLILSISGAIAITLVKPMSSPRNNEDEYYPEKRTIIFYSIPWILFTLVNATFAKNISIISSDLVSPSVYMILIVLQNVAALIGALLGGFIADYLGRKSTLVLSVTLYGVSMTLRGLINSEAIYFFAFASEGLSWGILLTLYIFVIWGDLSNKYNNAKVYSIGLIAFYLATGIGRLPSFISDLSLNGSALISCLLIFISNIPIVLAPELLSSDIREKIKTKKYMKTVKKVINKLQNQG